MQSSFWRQLILQWEPTEPLLHFYYALFAITFHHISAYSYITLSSVLRSSNPVSISLWVQFDAFYPLKAFNMSDLRPHWSTKNDFAHRSTYSLINNDFIHVEKIIVQFKINSFQMTKSFFAANYEMYNVHSTNDVINFTFLNKMSNIEIVLQNSHIFLFITSSSIKKNERNKMFFADFNAKKKLLTNKSFREKAVFFWKQKSSFLQQRNKIEYHNIVVKKSKCFYVWR